MADSEVVKRVRRVQEVYPDLAVETARLIRDQGQNNAILVVNDCLVFRFPLYAQGLERLEREVTILRGVKRFVTSAIPDPLYTSFEDRSPGKVFIGYALIPGELLLREQLDAIGDPVILHALGQQIGQFLKQLHQAPVVDLVPEELASFDPQLEWRGLYRRICDRLFPHMRADTRVATAKHFETFFDRATDRDVVPTLIHGDFGLGNILYDPRNWTISGVIDFDSAGIGDPAVDVAALPSGPPAFVRGLATTYPEITDAVERVQFYRGTFALQEALFGIEQGDNAAFRRGIAAYA